MAKRRVGVARPESTKLSEQVENQKSSKSKKPEYDGNTEMIISTGSTLLDLAISGGRIKGGGLPAGIFVEIFGPSGCGKTVLLCEIAGYIQRKEGQVMFHDPEARLNKTFAAMFDLNTEEIAYATPDTVSQVFEAVRKWDDIDSKKINGIMTDSLAALSTDLEMDKDEGDKMGMRRAKELSEQLRKTCRILKQKNLLMVCSNQIRENVDAGMFGQKYKSPGGHAVSFYASVRLRMKVIEKLKKQIKYKGKVITRIIGVRSEVEVYKNSVWNPYRIAPVTIIFDYGVDNIQENLQFLKKYNNTTMYELKGESLGTHMAKAIAMVEEQEREDELKEAVIELWEQVEQKFSSNRKKKKR
jgi:recombination protein RecA